MRGTQGDGDATEAFLHDHALEAVPISQRRSTFQLVAVAFGWAISVSGFLVGGTLGGGLRFGEGVAAILLGNGLLVVVASLIGLIGYRTGMTSYLIARSVFGRVGSIVVSLVLGILAMGFIGVLLDAFGNAFTALVPGIPWTAVVLLFAVAVLSTAMFGFTGLSWISRFAAPALVLLSIMGLVTLARSEGGFGTAINAVPETPISFGVGMTAVFATWITGAALTSDIARYAKRGRDVVLATFCGYVLGAGFFEFVAMISSNEAGTPDFVAAMSALGLLLPAVVVLVLALWTTTDNNLYSASLAFTHASELLGKTVAKPVWVVLSTAIAVGVAFLGFASNFLSFLQIIGIVTPPFAGVVITHFWVLGHIRRPAATLDVPPLRWEAIVAWIGTSVFAYFVDLPVEPVAALVIAGVVYAVLSLVTRPATQRKPDAAVEA
ncbi:cytosine permease [Egicoccus sp. AB-alg2]|uniref:purine-cytosine permease family protein n=1 Tax=Egicoccus sp. AB-alg2 TaxID=3242693 RepID=UPI00359D00CC